MPTKKKTSKSSAKSKGTKSSTKSRSSSGHKHKASKRTTKATKKSSSSSKKPKAISSSKKTKASSAAKSKKKSSPSKKVIKTKKVVRSKSSSTRKASRPKSPKPSTSKTTATSLAALSPEERYNAGGLCACVIDTTSKGGMAKLQRVLKHLQLSTLDQANLVRVSEGITIPKIFADGLDGENTRRKALQGLTQIVKADDPSGKAWKTELEDLGRLLGS